MALIVSLIDDIETQLVAELIKPGHIGIMAGPDRVEVIRLDHLQIPQRLFQRAHSSRHRIGFVAVDTPELNGRSVQRDHQISHFHPSESDFLCNDFFARVHDQRVQDGILCVPELRLVHVDRGAVRRR